MKCWGPNRLGAGALTGLGLAVAFAAALRWVPFPEDELARLPAAVVLADRHGEP